MIDEIKDSASVAQAHPAGARARSARPGAAVQQEAAKAAGTVALGASQPSVGTYVFGKDTAENRAKLTGACRNVENVEKTGLRLEDLLEAGALAEYTGKVWSDAQNLPDVEPFAKLYNKLLYKPVMHNVAYDRWNASMMVQALEDHGFTMIPFGQGFKDMSNPAKDLMRLVLEKSLAHDGHPVLRWNMDNIFIRTDPAGNLKVDKEKSTEKVDGAVALVMALDRALKNQGAGGSVCDSGRGLLFI